MKTPANRLMLILLGVGFFFALTASTRSQVDIPRDLPYEKVNTESRRVVPYPSLREADVMWSRRIWRIIDLRDKMNQFMYYPKEPTNGRRNFMDIIMKSILEDKTLKAYDPQYDDFRLQMTTAEVARIGVDTIRKTLTRPDPPYDEYDTVIVNPFEYSRVKKLKVKEDWFFDRQRSVLEVRILGICPVFDKLDPNTREFRGYSDMFWIYFPDLRKIIANEEVYMRFSNIAHQITYDDVFMKRLFQSYIYKEDNIYDRRIDQYVKNGLDALLESERIKETIRNFEHDLWEQ